MEFLGFAAVAHIHDDIGQKRVAGAEDRELIPRKPGGTGGGNEVIGEDEFIVIALVEPADRAAVIFTGFRDFGEFDGIHSDWFLSIKLIKMQLLKIIWSRCRCRRICGRFSRSADKFRCRHI